MAMKKRVTHRRRVRRNPAVAANPVRRRRRVRRNPSRGTSAAYRSGYDKAFGRPVPSTGIKRKRKSPKRVAAAKKAARTRARNLRAKASRPRRAHKRVSAPRRRKFQHRRHPGRVVGGLKMRYAPRSRRKVMHKVRRTVGHIRDRKGRRHNYYRYSVSRNPGTNMKNMLMDGASLYGGYVGARLVSGLLDQYVFSNASIAPTMLKLGAAKNIVSPAISFILAAFAGKLIPQPKVVSSIQTGATLAFFQSIVKAFVTPAVAQYPLLAGALSGIDDMGFRGYGEYIQPRRQLGEYIQQRPQLGAYVQEAMALDEYVQDPGGMHGFDVQEALADSEVQGMQSGFAAGSLAKTVFSNF